MPCGFRIINQASQIWRPSVEELARITFVSMNRIEEKEEP